MTEGEAPTLYQLLGRVDSATWRACAPFLYAELRCATADAEFYLRRYPVVRVINKSTGQVEYTASRV